MHIKSEKPWGYYLLLLGLVFSLDILIFIIHLMEPGTRIESLGKSRSEYSEFISLWVFAYFLVPIGIIVHFFWAYGKFPVKVTDEGVDLRIGLKRRKLFTWDKIVSTSHWGAMAPALKIVFEGGPRLVIPARNSKFIQFLDSVSQNRQDLILDQKKFFRFYQTAFLSGLFSFVLFTVVLFFIWSPSTLWGICVTRSKINYCTVANAMGFDVNGEYHVFGRKLDGLTPLFIAVKEDSPEVVSFLLEHGANVNAKFGRSQSTPIFYAISAEKPRNVELLIKHGADLTVENSAGKSPFDLAREKGSEEIIRILEK